MIDEKLLEKARLKGSEREYLDWLRLWPSCLTDTYSHWDNGIGYCEPSHVDMVELGKGIAHKAEYMATPLTHDEHAELHRSGMNKLATKEFFKEQAIDYLCRWINGVKPPEPEEQKNNWKKEYVIESASRLTGIYLLLKKFFSLRPNQAVKITIQRHVKRRSKQQNKAQWKVIYGHVQEFYEKNPEAFLRDALAWLQLALQRSQLNKDLVHELCKGLHNNGKSTASLSTMESSDYFKEIRSHLFNEYGYDFPEIINPNEYKGDYHG